MADGGRRIAVVISLPRQIFTDRLDLGKVDVYDRDHQHHQHYEADLEDAFFDAKAEVAARESFDGLTRKSGGDSRPPAPS